MQLVPMVQRHPPALVCRTGKPVADRIFIDLDTPRSAADRISFRQRTDRKLENGRISIQIEVGRAVGHRGSPTTGATPGLRMAMTAAILDQQRLPKRHAVVATVPIRAVQCFPVHCILDQ
jgi:hypothetical protein